MMPFITFQKTVQTSSQGQLQLTKLVAVYCCMLNTLFGMLILMLIVNSYSKEDRTKDMQAMERIKVCANGNNISQLRSQLYSYRAIAITYIATPSSLGARSVLAIDRLTGKILKLSVPGQVSMLQLQLALIIVVFCFQIYEMLIFVIVEQCSYR